MKKKGISLIVLVITIIIIIILAGAVILNLNNNNPVDNARRSNVHQTRDSLRSGINLYAAKVILSENGLYNASTLLLGKNVNTIDSSIIVNYASKLTGTVRGKQIDLWQLDYQLVNEKVGIKLEHLDSNSYWCIDEFGNPYLVYNSKSNVAGFLKGEDGEILPSLSDFVIYIEGAQFVSSSEQTAVSSLKNSITSTVTSYITSKKAELGSNLTTKNIILGEGVASGSEIASSTDPYNVTINGNETKLYKIDSAKYEAKTGKTLENTYESGDWCIDENGNVYLVFANQSSIPSSLSNASMSSYVTYNGATVTTSSSSSDNEDDNEEQEWTGKIIEASAITDYTQKKVTINVSKSKYNIVSIVNRTTSETISTNSTTGVTNTLEDGTYEFDITDEKGNVETLSVKIVTADIVISSASDLEAFRDSVNAGNTYEGKTIIQTSDITISENWTPIGVYSDYGTCYPFKGNYDGLGHSVTLNISGNNSYQALFSYVQGPYPNRSEIINVVVKGSISGYNYISGVVADGRDLNIINCGNEANVTSSYAYASGIIARANARTTVMNCYNKGEIISGFGVGGIIGQARSSEVKIENCYNIAKITGDRCGGIVGYNSSSGETLINCYNIGQIVAASGDITDALSFGSLINSEYAYNQTVTNSYYLDTLEANSAFGEAKTSSELKAIAPTLGSAYKADTSNKNGGYPILSWE